LSRRTEIATLATVAAAVLAGTAAAQAPFPGRPVRIIVGFPAGGPLDAHARLLAERLGQLLGQPITVDCKAGAGGTVGADVVATSEPDGDTLLLAKVAQGADPAYAGPEDFARFLAAEMPKWAEAVEDSGVRLD
jgi:tripartite-type tricarboxylate transporter receptor subunit TctC